MQDLDGPPAALATRVCVGVGVVFQVLLFHLSDELHKQSLVSAPLSVVRLGPGPFHRRGCIGRLERCERCSYRGGDWRGAGSSGKTRQDQGVEGGSFGRRCSWS